MAFNRYLVRITSLDKNLLSRATFVLEKKILHQCGKGHHILYTIYTGQKIICIEYMYMYVAGNVVADI